MGDITTRDGYLWDDRGDEWQAAAYDLAPPSTPCLVVTGDLDTAKRRLREQDETPNDAEQDDITHRGGSADGRDAITDDAAIVAPTSDDIKAALLLLANLDWRVQRTYLGAESEYQAWHRTALPSVIARGGSPAAAVLALAAKFEESARDDAECRRCASDPADGLGCVACDARLLPDSDKDDTEQTDG